jgi:hypothetical protein
VPVLRHLAPPFALPKEVHVSKINWVNPDMLGKYAESEYAQQAIEIASWILWALSGKRYSGFSTVTEVYADLAKTEELRYGFTVPRNLPRSETTRIRLTGFPVLSVESVADGAGRVIPASEYYLTNHTTLHLNQPVHTDLQVTYTYGSMPPLAGIYAARALALQFIHSYEDDGDCTLPTRVTSVSRQDISYVMLDQQDFLADLRTGVYEVDLFLKSVNPDAARVRAKVFSPSVRRGRRTSKPVISPIMGEDGNGGQ